MKRILSDSAPTVQLSLTFSITLLLTMEIYDLNTAIDPDNHASAQINALTEF